MRKDELCDGSAVNLLSAGQLAIKVHVVVPLVIVTRKLVVVPLLVLGPFITLLTEHPPIR